MYIINVLINIMDCSRKYKAYMNFVHRLILYIINVQVIPMNSSGGISKPANNIAETMQEGHSLSTRGNKDCASNLNSQIRRNRKRAFPWRKKGTKGLIFDPFVPFYSKLGLLYPIFIVVDELCTLPLK